MKSKILLVMDIVLVVAVILFMTGCFGNPETPTTAPTNAPVTEPTTGPTTEPPTTHTEPGEHTGTPIDDETLRYFEQEIFSYPSWYNMILTTQFSTPEEADLYMIFYNGIGDSGEVAASTELTQEEIDFLADQGHEMEYAYSRISADKMNSVLLRYLGISLEESDQQGLEEFIYMESTGCYYHKHTDANMLMDFTIDSGYTAGDGTICLYYTINKNSNPRFSETRAVVLRPVETEQEQTYHVLSNQTAE